MALARENRFSFKRSLPKNSLNLKSFNVRYERNKEGLKAGVVVSKKVDKRATVRNRVKRVILEEVSKLPKDTNLTLVFYAKAESVESVTIKEEIAELILKINGSTN